MEPTKIRDKPWKKYPMSLEEAADEVMAHLSEESKQKLSNSPKGGLIAFHDNLGLLIRNKLGLWDYYRGREETCKHPDWTSYFIIEALWNRLQNSDETGVF